MKQSRRRILQQLGLGLAAAPFGALGIREAFAQSDYPSRAVRIVLPFSAGGSTDVVTRVLADGLAKAWGKPVVVDNRPGAAGMIGADSVAKSPADGYTLLCTLTNLVQAPVLFGKAPYNAQRDFVPIAELGTMNLVLVVQADLPVKNVKELVDYIRKQGAPFPYGSYALGGTGHLLMEIFGKNANVPLVHVPYKGEAPLVNDLIGGQVQAGIISAGFARNLSKKVRPIAVTGTQRAPLLPDVPTFGQQGIKGLERQGWAGLFAPAGTPPAIVEKIAADARKLLPATQARVSESGWVLTGSSPAEFASVYKTDERFWADTIKSSGIHLE